MNQIARGLASIDTMSLDQSNLEGESFVFLDRLGRHAWHMQEDLQADLGTLEGAHQTQTPQSGQAVRPVQREVLQGRRPAVRRTTGRWMRSTLLEPPNLGSFARHGHTSALGSAR